MNAPSTLFEKIWRPHVVLERHDQSLLYIDRHYLGDDLPDATFQTLAQRGLPIRRPDATYAMPDHYAPTHSRATDDVVDARRRSMVIELRQQSARAGVTHFGLDDPRHGIVHIVGPELGLTLPGMTVVCGDSHTSTHGALGAFGFGIGATEVTHVLATQTLWQARPATLRLTVQGQLPFGVTAKDLALHLIATIGAAGATGYVIEYAGPAVRALSMEARMTLCNMSIEAGARAGMIAPDAVTLDYLRGRPYSPAGEQWDSLSAAWLALASDIGATYDQEIALDADTIQPMVSWGTSPMQSCPVGATIPLLESYADPLTRERVRKALDYMQLAPGAAVVGTPVDRVFIGSCTNGRIEDLRLAASVIRGRRARIPALVVPGSGLVRRQAEEEGLDKIFTAAGFTWAQPGCSMCLAINGDMGRPGERCVSTTNRNFVGRQGPGVLTHLVNPGMAAAAAIHGRLVDYRPELTHAIH